MKNLTLILLGFSAVTGCGPQPAPKLGRQTGIVPTATLSPAMPGATPSVARHRAASPTRASSDTTGVTIAELASEDATVSLVFRGIESTDDQGNVVLTQPDGGPKTWRHEGGEHSFDGAASAGLALNHCERFDVMQKAKQGAARQLLTFCNDGYGASGVGEDTLALTQTTLTHRRAGGSAWRWNEQHQYRLPTFTPLQTESDYYYSASPTHPHSHDTWDYVAWSGTNDWKMPECQNSGQAGAAPKVRSGNSSTIPVLSIDADYLADAWKRIGLGDCATSFGRAPAGKKPFIRAAMHDQQPLVIEVFDSKVEPGDYLELITTIEGLGVDHCIGSNPATQVRRIAPLAAAQPADIEVVRTKNGFRVKASIPLQGVTLRYHDKRHGLSQSNPGVATDAHSLGRLHRLGEEWSCSLEQGRMLRRQIRESIP